MESKASLRFARLAPRKARVVINLVRGQKVAQALDMLAWTRKSGAPILKKLIESAIANAKQADSTVDVDKLYVTGGMADKGPNRNLRRWRPRAMGRATQITKGVSHIHIWLSDVVPVTKKSQRDAEIKARRATRIAAQGAAAGKTTTTTTTTAG